MPDVRPWARVVGDVNIHLRRGAWYEVVWLLPDAAVLHVSERCLTIPRSCLEIVEVLPRQWSVVARPYDAVDLPLSWGSRYGCARAAATARWRTMLQRSRAGAAAACLRWGRPER